LLNTNLTAVGLQLKKSLEETHGEGKEEMWGNEEDDYDPYILAWLKTKRIEK